MTDSLPAELLKPRPEDQPPPTPPRPFRPESAVGHVAVRLPSFWPANPDVWFHQVECHFDLAGITSQLTRYRHVVSVLPPTIASELTDILSAPPQRNPYDALRAAVLDRTMVSERTRLQQLLSAEELGGPTANSAIAPHAEPPW